MWTLISSAATCLRTVRVAHEKFYDYEIVLFANAPLIDVYLVAKGDAPRGVGEAAILAVAPALANAVFAATGN